MLKRAILLSGPGAALAVVLAVVLTASPDLPDPIATHWAASGEPDGSTPLWAFVGGTALVLLIAWGVLLVHGRRRAADGLRMTAAPAVWAVSAFLTGMLVATLTANEGAESWREADHVSIPTITTVAMIAALACLTAWALERGRPIAERPDGEAASPVAIAPGEQVVWTRALASRPAVLGCVAVGGGLVVSGLLAGGTRGWFMAAGGVLVALLASVLTEIVATVDARGLTIAYGPLGWPRQTVPLADVAQAEATRIDPWRLGGWGWRKVPGRPGATAVVLRGGEGLRVTRADGRELLVTIPDAATAAGLLEALAARERTPAPR